MAIQVRALLRKEDSLADEPAQQSLLCERTDWPEELLDVPAVLIQQVLDKPTLIHLPGVAAEPIFVSVLLHGNEDVGLKAIQQLITRYQGRRLPRALSIFLGNVEAATAGVRFLPHQLDYNRVWPHAGQSLAFPEQFLVRDVFDRMIARKVAASIDLHNNSGRNPHYSCICSVESDHLKLASLFGPRVMFFTRPLGVQTAAFAPICPSITCECGPIGDASGVRAAVDLLERLMALGAGSLRAALPSSYERVQLFRTVGTWRILPQATFSFDSRAISDVFLRPDLDRLNFERLVSGTELGQVNGELGRTMEVCDENGMPVTDKFLTADGNGTVRLTTDVIPSMLTTSAAAIRQDCIGYFMSVVDRSAIDDHRMCSPFSFSQ